MLSSPAPRIRKYLLNSGFVTLLLLSPDSLLSPPPLQCNPFSHLQGHVHLIQDLQDSAELLLPTIPLVCFFLAPGERQASAPQTSGQKVPKSPLWDFGAYPLSSAMWSPPLVSSPCEQQHNCPSWKPAGSASPIQFSPLPSGVRGHSSLNSPSSI